ncbi:protein-export membrane protein SecF [Campylobacterota bacterium]|nr:protein-export membrane protein SecF [Campylobacterota bacterium]
MPALFSYTKIYPFSKYQLPVLIFFGLLVVGSILLTIFKTPNYGIDFAGGTVIQVRYDGAAPIDSIRTALVGSRFEGAQIQEFGSASEAVIKAPASTNELGSDVSDEIGSLLKETGSFEIRRVDMVGAKVGEQLRTAGTMAVIVSLIGILIYITIRFEWRFAIAAVLCTVHDVLVSLGFVLLFEVPINLDILAAILTILGFSLNDTIVIFDRIREMLGKAGVSKLDNVIDEAISRTLSRTTLPSSFVLAGALITASLALPNS